VYRVAKARYRIQVIDRAFQILDIVAEDGVELGVTELAGRLKLHKSTAHRLAMVLESNQFLECDANGKFRLGRRLMQLGMRVLSRLDICEIAWPHLRRLVSETGETAHVGVLRDGEVVSIVNVQERSDPSLAEHCWHAHTGALHFARKSDSGLLPGRRGAGSAPAVQV
jgi:DNA-binding IclR family transcriptional regulator